MSLLVRDEAGYCCQQRLSPSGPSYLLCGSSHLLGHFDLDVIDRTIFESIVQVAHRWRRDEEAILIRSRDAIYGVYEAVLSSIELLLCSDFLGLAAG